MPSFAWRNHTTLTLPVVPGTLALKRLLEKTTLPLAEVCSLSGFSSKAYFTAAFNEATGTTPLGWRITKSRHP